MELTNYTEKETNKVLIYGRAKVGKTALVGRLAERYKLHWLDLEDGVKTLLNPDLLDPKFRSNINVTRIPDTQTIPMAIETVLKIIKGAECRICWKHGKVACVACSKDPALTDTFSTICLDKFTKDDVLVIDSVTQLSLSALNAVIKGELLKDNWEYKATFHDYRAQGFMLDRIFGTMQAGNFNCVAISHENLVETEGGKELITPAAGTRNFSRNFSRYFDSVVYLDVVNKKHRAFSSTVYDGRIITGSRQGIEIEKDDTASIINLFQRKEKAEVKK